MLKVTLVLPDGGRLPVAGSNEWVRDLALRFHATDIVDGWD